MTNRVFLTVFIVTVILNYGQGQQIPDSLLRYMEIAAENNPAVMREFTGYKAALQKIPQAGSLTDPQMSIGVFLKPMEILSGNQVADLSLMQMFPWFGVLKNAKDEMSLMAKAKYEQFRDAKFQVYFDVQRSWYELFKIKKEITISEKNIEILKTIERLAVIKFKSPGAGPAGTQSGAVTPSGTSFQNPAANSSAMGMAGNQGNNINISSSGNSPSMQNSSMGISASGSGLADIYRIQIEVGDLENSIALLRSSEQTTKALFNSYLNRPPMAPVFTVETLIPDSLGLPVEAVFDSIRTRNPMLKMLDFERQSLFAKKKMATAMGYPMVGVGINYSVISKSEMSSSTMNGNDMIMPMLTITLPLYRKKYKALQNEADLLTVSSAQNSEATANSLSNEYYQAVQSYEDASRRKKLYKNQYLLASKLLDLMVKSFSASSSGLTDVLRVHQQSLDYELKQTEAIVDLNTSIAWLRRLMASSPVK